MNEAIQKISEIAPEVWHSAIQRIIFINGVGVALLWTLALASFWGTYKLWKRRDEEEVFYIGFGLCLAFGVLFAFLSIFAVADLIYPEAPALKSLIGG